MFFPTIKQEIVTEHPIEHLLHFKIHGIRVYIFRIHRQNPRNMTGLVTPLHQRLLTNSGIRTTATYLAPVGGLIYHWVSQQLDESRTQILPDYVSKLGVLDEGGGGAGEEGYKTV